MTGPEEAPTFTPSFRQIFSSDPKKPKDCHYIITAGVIHYCCDSFHEMRGRWVVMPDIPEDMENHR